MPLLDDLAETYRRLELATQAQADAQYLFDTAPTEAKAQRREELTAAQATRQALYEDMAALRNQAYTQYGVEATHAAINQGVTSARSSPAFDPSIAVRQGYAEGRVTPVVDNAYTVGARTGPLPVLEEPALPVSRRLPVPGWVLATGAAVLALLLVARR